MNNNNKNKTKTKKKKKKKRKRRRTATKKNFTIKNTYRPKAKLGQAIAGRVQTHDTKHAVFEAELGEMGRGRGERGGDSAIAIQPTL